MVIGIDRKIYFFFGEMKIMRFIYFGYWLDGEFRQESPYLKYIFKYLNSCFYKRLMKNICLNKVL